MKFLLSCDFEILSLRFFKAGGRRWPQEWSVVTSHTLSAVCLCRHSMGGEGATRQTPKK
jgi:hypothetical protein